MPRVKRHVRSDSRTGSSATPSAQPDDRPRYPRATSKLSRSTKRLIRKKSSVCRDRLGLALAGGGFRAALFHVGVFRRLAELDLLRYVEVLSTVSGGSIVGALYVLLLKRELERKAGVNNLEQPVYIRIVDDLETRLVAGARKNLRALLFSNPFDLIRMILSPGRTLGTRMAELYERHVYASTIRELRGRDDASQPLLLSELRVYPGQKDITDWIPDADIDSYNREQVENGGSAITKLVINSTSLNTGSRFLFKATEIGEWHYGYARIDEAKDLAKKYKVEIDAVQSEPMPYRMREYVEPPETLARWVITGESSHLTRNARKLLEDWPQRHRADDREGCGAGLEQTRKVDLGLLRLARLSAWHLLKLDSKPELHFSGGRTAVEHRHELTINLGLITHNYAEWIEKWLGTNQSRLMLLCAFINEVYLYRSARNVAASIDRDWARWSLSKAVAASTNFPPVFPPLVEYQTYDDLVVSRLGLSDGGVYDNIGVVGLLNEGCNYVISSDTGLVDKPVQHVSQGYFGMFRRIASITGDSADRHMRAYLVDRHQVSTGLEVAYWMAKGNTGSASKEVARQIDLVHSTRQMQGYIGMRIDSSAVLENEARESKKKDEATLPDFNAATVGSLRTDLDRFGDIEVNALINQGYANAGLFIKQWLDYDPKESSAKDLPDHARRRYAANSCGDYLYSGARKSNYRDARRDPLFRPIANTAENGKSDPRDKRAGRVLRAGRHKLFRVLQAGPPWTVGIMLAWIAFFAIIAGIVFSELPDTWIEHCSIRLTIHDLYLLLAGVAIYKTASWGAGKVINRGIQKSLRKGKLNCARRLSAMRRWPARLWFWLLLLALATFGWVFWPSPLEQVFTEQLVSAAKGLAIEAVVMVGLVLLVTLIGWLMWLDSWFASAVQRLNKDGRP